MIVKIHAYILASTFAFMPVLAGCSGKHGASAQKMDHMVENSHEHNPQMHQQNAEHQMQASNAGHQLQDETRTDVVLSAGERQHVLMEMRGLLQSTQGIIEGLGAGDMGMVQKHALAAGTKGRNSPANQVMHQKMPEGWMRYGMKAHKTMDVVAKMATDGKPATEIQLKLAEAMSACTACHAAYTLPAQ